MHLRQKKMFTITAQGTLNNLLGLSAYVVTGGRTWMKRVNYTLTFKKMLPLSISRRFTAPYPTKESFAIHTLGGRGFLCMDVAVARLVVRHARISSLNSITLRDNPWRFYCHQILTKYIVWSYCPLLRIYLWNITCCKHPDGSKANVLRPVVCQITPRHGALGFSPAGFS